MTNATIQTYSTIWKALDQNGHWKRHTDHLPAITADTDWINKDSWHLQTKVSLTYKSFKYYEEIPNNGIKYTAKNSVIKSYT
jgi:hypothetical protein